MGSQGSSLAESERGVWFRLKRHSICTPHFNRKHELILFRGRKPILQTPNCWSPGHEYGFHQKQSSCVFIAKSVGVDMTENVAFNGARAHINANDARRPGCRAALLCILSPSQTLRPFSLNGMRSLPCDPSLATRRPSFFDRIPCGPSLVGERQRRSRKAAPRRPPAGGAARRAAPTPSLAKSSRSNASTLPGEHFESFTLPPLCIYKGPVPVLYGAEGTFPCKSKVLRGGLSSQPLSCQPVETRRHCKLVPFRARIRS